MTQDTFMGRSIYGGKKSRKMPLGSKIYPVKSGVYRLSMPAIKEAISMLRNMSALPEDMFKDFYIQLLESYGEFVQLIPEREDVPSQSMLGNGIRRSLVMTQAFIEKMKAREGVRFLDSDYGSRWVFSVFSSSLLFRVAKLFVDKQISLCDQEGRFLCNWQYFHKPMSAYGKYFKMRHLPFSSSSDASNFSSNIVSDMTIVLAKQLMPELAFNWIMEDQMVLACWFKALNIQDEIFSVHQMGLDVEFLMQNMNLLIILSLHHHKIPYHQSLDHDCLHQFDLFQHPMQ